MICPLPATRLAAVAVIVALVAGCNADTTTGDSSPPSASAAATSTPEAGTSSPDDAPTGSVQGLLDAWVTQGRGGVAVALAGDDEDLTVAAAGSVGLGGGTIEPDSEFRVGSLSKTFVAVMILQLVADGTIGLDDLVVNHAPALTIADGVTIRQLLAHRSGIPEHTDGELGPAVLADPSATWTPVEVLDLIADQPRDFPPDAQFAYSNSNYIAAGFLLETVTGETLADNLRRRIVDPVALTSTYFAPNETRSPIGGFSPSLPGGDTSGVSYRALETAAGAAGALVSNVSDLAVFIRALSHGGFLPDDVYAQMTSGLPATGMTLGVFASDPPTTTGISNGGAIPGYTAYMQYDPTTEDLFVLLTNDDSRSPEDLADELLTIIRSD